jgi:hypothetical protein
MWLPMFALSMCASLVWKIEGVAIIGPSSSYSMLKG